jgi:hypothetical protein
MNYRRRIPSAPALLTPIVLFSLSLSGCATRTVAHRTTSAAPEMAARSADANGIWDWVYRSTDDQGDMRIEQEEWHLVQKGRTIDGYYDRVVTLMSTDERLFRCNQKLGFTKTTRVKISGQIEGDRVTLRETAFQAAASPCDDGARNLVAYVGVLRQGTLSLRWGPEAGQTLVRRTDGGAALADTVLVGAMEGGDSERPTPAAPSAQLASVPVEGTWEWDLRSIDADGDERQEREEWHLSETSDGIKGYYDRTVRRIRVGGAFPCNGEGRYETTTRYSITGQRFGDKLTLTEVDYKATPSKCDNALRRLDTYQGQVADPESMVLSWGPGNQLLRRARAPRTSNP